MAHIMRTMCPTCNTETMHVDRKCSECTISEQQKEFNQFEKLDIDTKLTFLLSLIKYDNNSGREPPRNQKILILAQHLLRKEFETDDAIAVHLYGIINELYDRFPSTRMYA